MRPLQLTMTAFGPYAGTEVVDFDALTDLGLFVVAGNNGSGKTTIFDALHYSLFGTLPGRRADYVRLRSDHAPASIECSVVLDFVAKGARWRVRRSPKQQRPKRRGTGFTQAERKATLFRLDNDSADVATAVANKIGEVNERCCELVGLSGRQFERVALLPQGEFSRVLSESGDRRALLRTLFSSEVFGDATSLLTERATQATAADLALVEHLDSRRDTIAHELAAVTGHEVAGSEEHLLSVAKSIRTGMLGELQAQVAELELQAQQASRAHHQAVEISDRIQRRDQVLELVAVHRANATEHQRDLQRLAHARSAVPVTSQARALAQQQHRRQDASRHVQQIRAKADRALTTAGLEPLHTVNIDSLKTTLHELTLLAERLTLRRTAARKVSDLEAVVNRLHAEFRRRTNELTTLQEKSDIAHAQKRRLGADIDKIRDAPDTQACERELQMRRRQLEQRSALAELTDQHDANVDQARRAALDLERAHIAHDTAASASTARASLETKAQAAVDTLEQLNRRHHAAQEFVAASNMLSSLRADRDRAQAFAIEQWNAFISGAAVRIAEALVIDEPCPVCGSQEHPSPATSHGGDPIATQDDVTQARAVADDIASKLTVVELQIEALHATHADIAVVSITELSAEIRTAKAMALGARAAADHALQASAQLDELRAHVVSKQAATDDLAEQLRHIDEQRNQLRGALGAAASTPVDDIAAITERAWQARVASEQAHANAQQLQSQFSDVETTIESLGLERMAAQNRHASTEAQLAERETDLRQALADLTTFDMNIATAPASGASIDDEIRVQATRHADELLRELSTALALANEAADGERRATTILQERLEQSPFESVEQSQHSFLEPSIVDQLDAQTQQYVATRDRLQGQLEQLAELPAETPDLRVLKLDVDKASDDHAAANRQAITLRATLDRLTRDIERVASERSDRGQADIETRRLERVAALVKGDNERNTSLENWVLAAHLRDVVELANIRLAKSTHQRFQLCVLDNGENRRGTWGLDLGVEDTVTGTRRPTAGLSGGELFQASLALALGLADAVMNQSAGVQIDALFIDEGFGSLDETSVERAIDLLDELRDQGALVGVITHVPALLEALPRGITVVDGADGTGSSIQQQRRAA